ncbi:HFL091Wp [Eremothecium sinecaudum]|uniref:HFL091Wp n=1 Tax=Eremothecium sinecaudum TaxID=45286 RepID=A0A120K2J9_9SACH|nr:HFL091Wp [Eremothecium sinecaudum]AMD21765.1 HFL091Wp [Eremothecium sinecaudum]
MLNIWKFLQFIGPGIMVSVAYMDPGNYSTSVAGGAQFKYELLFSIFVSNLFAIVLQCLCVKLGTVTGLDLAENCRRHLPRKLNYALFGFAEFAIIATDLAEVVGTAIALEILFGIPLTFGVLLTVLDVLFILIFYRPEKHSMKQVRMFETFVSVFVGATLVCFVLELSKLTIVSKWELFRGFMPSKVVFKEQQAMYISLGILGATVMPHSLYLGSSLVKPRLHDYDIKKYGKVRSTGPSLAAVKYTLNVSYVELIISLFFIATFVNSAILIVAGATLYGEADAGDADLLTIYQLLCKNITPAAGLIFALAMLFSGQSAGVICTMSGQIVSSGFLNWTIDPWKTRLCTRMLAIVPCLLATIFMGSKGIASMLNFSQVVLSLLLPIVSAPLLYFTANRKIMTVSDFSNSLYIESDEHTSLVVNKETEKDYTNSSWLTATAVGIWIIISSLNSYLVFSFLMGADVHF